MQLQLIEPITAEICGLTVLVSLPTLIMWPTSSSNILKVNHLKQKLRESEVKLIVMINLHSENGTNSKASDYVILVFI